MNSAPPPDTLDSLLARHWHHLPAAEVLALFETDGEHGLDTFAVARRQAEHGANRLTARRERGPLALLLGQFDQPLVLILLAATVITAVLGEWVDSSVILAVVLINAAIGFAQESRARAAIAALARHMEGAATVVRAGHRQRIASRELVPGDLVLLEAGDKVPADLRLLRQRELRIDESTLTGESLPAAKHPDSLPPDMVLAERACMAYSSTLVSAGTGAGIVVAIGDQTEVGRINTLIGEAVTLATPLTRKINAFSAVLLRVILALAVLCLLAGHYHGHGLLDTFMAAVALAVGAIPEGLPAAMSIMLAIGVHRMARRHAIVRRMPAVETLGSTTVIGSDKTGTLTRNEMTVQFIHAGDVVHAVSGVGYAPCGAVAHAGGDAPRAALDTCLLAGVLCNDAQLAHVEGRWSIDGDPTEAALLVAAAKGGRDTHDDRRCWPRLDALPFEARNQYMATCHGHADGRRIIFVKGALEALLPRCSEALGADGTPRILETALVQREAEALATRGLRVLAFACRTAPADQDTLAHDDIAQGLTFIGLQAMLDPPREEVIAAVAACQRAGIRVKMITGDHVATAAAIAHRIGIADTATPDFAYAVTGYDLARLSDTELLEVALRTAVFARVSPTQKLRLVEALQRHGEVVAMTGDGVNDAPALKQADIGIAMGSSGTEVAKEAADMILTDDNFASIEAAVEEGRTVFDNLVKFITWTLPTNLGEGLVILCAILAGTTLPITPVQILWINMTTAILLGLTLAFETREPGTMQRPPRPPGMPVLTRALAGRIVLVSVLLLIGSFGAFELALGSGHELAAARTVAVNMFVFGELFYLFNCRSLSLSMFALGPLSNPWLIAGVVSMTLLQLAFTYLPTMHRLFGSAPIDLAAWSWIVAGGLTIYLVVGAEKWLRRHHHATPG